MIVHSCNKKTKTKNMQFLTNSEKVFIEKESEKKDIYEKTCHKKAVIENMYILPIYPVPDGSLCIHYYRGHVRRGSEGTLTPPLPPRSFLDQKRE